MQVYADNAATTAMSRTAIDAMLPYLDNIYGNPSSLHSVGQRAKEALDAARETVAQCLGCEPREIIFTSGGSEADNQAIISAARYGEKKGKKHIITTAFEHHAVLHTLAKLEKEGFEVTYLDVRKGHNVTAQQVKDAIRQAGMEFVAAYDAFTRNAPREDSERIYVIARERGKSSGENQN